jgi:5-methylcytosine-specific restriction endonuclease McrA
MIKLTRLDISNELRTRIEQRAERLHELLEAGSDPPQALLDSYRDADLKAHLIVEAHGKCVYCESKITHVYFGDVEHIKPKARFPAERLDPVNLALACAVCNNAKGDFWDEATPLLNPYTDEPDEEILALGYLIARRPGRNRARLTIERLDLNRHALLERRKERIELLQPLADQYMLEPPGSVKDLLRNELCRQAGEEGEYAMIVRAYLEAACYLQCFHFGP